MPKEIVKINSDPNVALIKQFRELNKEIGDAVKNGEEERAQLISEQLIVLQKKAHENHFEIWVNQNGKTGHTYSKDYKATSDDDNNLDVYHQQRQNFFYYLFHQNN
jgi:hypothetical protein